MDVKDLDLGQDDRKICIFCAWRETCVKRFSGVEAMHCPDFTYDVTLGRKDDKGDRERDKGVLQRGGKEKPGEDKG